MNTPLLQHTGPMTKALCLRRRTRKVPTIIAALRLLNSAGFVTDDEVSTYTKAFTTGDKRGAWDELASRFSLTQRGDADGLTVILPLQ